MSYSVTITRVDNGYTASQTDDEDRPQMVVFQDRDDFPTVVDVRAVANMLWGVAEYFGALGSKHDSERLRISVVNQDGKDVEE